MNGVSVSIDFEFVKIYGKEINDVMSVDLVFSIKYSRMYSGISRLLFLLAVY